MNLQNSPGFMYYDLSNESPGFIPLSSPNHPQDSSNGPQECAFSPQSYSSPQTPQHYKRGNQSRGNYHNRSWNKSFNKSPNTPNNNYSKFRKSFDSPNTSYGSHGNPYQNVRRGFKNQSHNRSYNKSIGNQSQPNENQWARYLHPSFTEDPWAHLQKLNQNKNMDVSSTETK